MRFGALFLIFVLIFTLANVLYIPHALSQEELYGLRLEDAEFVDYTGSGNIVWRDLSGHGNDGTVYGATPIIINRTIRLSFDGDDYVEVLHDPSLTPTDLTIEIMVKWTGGSYGLLRKGHVDSVYYTNYAIYYSNTQCRIYFGIGGTSYWERSIGTPKPGEWTWLAVTFKDKAEVRAYQDGALTGVWDIDFSYYKDDSHLIIGAFDWSRIRYFMAGEVAFVRIYNRALNDTEILWNYQHLNYPVLDGLVLWLGRFDYIAIDFSNFINKYYCRPDLKDVYTEITTAINEIMIIYDLTSWNNNTIPETLFGNIQITSNTRSTANIPDNCIIFEATRASQYAPVFYSIRFKYEENATQATLYNLTLMIDNTICSFDNAAAVWFAFSSKPERISLSIESYSRGYYPRSNWENITFYVAGSDVYAYTFLLKDLTNTFQCPGTILRVKKLLGGETVIITEEPFDSQSKANAFLKLGEQYQIEVDNWATLRNMGFITTDNDFEKAIYVAVIQFGQTASQVMGYNITWEVTWDQENQLLTIKYSDKTGETNNVHIEVYESNPDELAYQTDVQSSDFSVTFQQANSTKGYYVVLQVDHDIFGTFIEKKPVGAPVIDITPFTTLLNSTLGPLPHNLSYDDMISTFLVIFTALCFSAITAGIGAIAAALVAGFCWYNGWFHVPFELIAAIFVIAVIFKLVEKRVVR